MPKTIEEVFAILFIIALLAWGEWRLNKFKRDHGLE